MKRFLQKVLFSMLFMFLVFGYETLSAEVIKKPVVFYLQNLPQERIGSLSDEVIIDSLRNQNLIVIPVDCSSFPATSPELEERLIEFHGESPAILETYNTTLEEADLDNVFYVPEGYLLRTQIPVWNIQEHGAEGSMDRIMDTYNKEIVEKYGVTPVSDADDMVDKHGNPIDYNMYMHLIYPSGTAEEDVPLLINFASNSPMQNSFNPTVTNERLYRNIFPLGFLTTGYAWANVDHCYNPLAKGEVWGYFDRYSLEDWNGLALVTAYIRYINSHLEQYNLDGKIGVMGISKASYSSIRISNTQNAEGREHFLFGGEENTKVQPWPGVPSTVDVAYAAAGNGTRRVNTYVDEYTVPMITSAGSKDEYNQWDAYPEVVRRFRDLDINHLAFWMEELGHTYPGLGIDLATGENRYKLFKRYFDGYLKTSSSDPLEVFYIYPKENAPEVDTDGLTRILVHDGVLPAGMLGLTPFAPITVRFLSAVDSVAFAQHVKIYHKNTNAEIAGHWTPKTENTTYEFTTDVRFQKDDTYRIVVSAELENMNGQKMAAEVVREFTITQDGEEDVDTESLLLSPTDDTYQKVALGTTVYGDQNTMRVRYSPYGDWRFDGYIKFDLSGLDAEKIKSAHVRLSSSTTLAGEPVQLTIFKTTTDWTESTLVSANKPTALDNGLDMVYFTGTELWTSFDITSQLKTDLDEAQAQISFMIRAATGGSTENVYFNTKEAENEELHPVLVIDEIVIDPGVGIAETPFKEFRYHLSDKHVYLITPEPISTGYRLFSLAGQTMKSGRIIDNSPIDVSHLKEGLYILTLDDINKAIKVLVQ